MEENHVNYLDNVLPLEILVHILRFLGIKQAVQCRLVSKKWQYLIDNYVSNDELSLFINCHKQTNLFDLKNFYLSSERSLYFKDKELFNYDLNQRFKRIKVLCITETYYDSFKYRKEFEDLINSFLMLEHLEIKFIYLRLNLIKLKKLKSLSIRNSMKKIEIKNIVCPSLTELSIGLTSSCLKNYFMPNVKKLICYCFQDWVKNLVNLETLIIGILHKKDLSFLICFKMLNYLDIYKTEKCVLKKLLDDKNRFKMQELAIHYKGLNIELIKKEDFNFIDKKFFGTIRPEAEVLPRTFNNFYSSEDVIEIYSGSLAKTAKTLHFFNDFYITDELKFFCLAYNLEFFNKLREVTFVTILDNILSETEIIDILKNLPIVKQLFFEGVNNLGQTFFDQLPSACPYITDLNLKENNQIKFHDLSFLSFFKELHAFKVSCINLSKSQKDNLNEVVNELLQNYAFKKTGISYLSIILLPI